MNYICIEGKEGASTLGKSYEVKRDGLYYCYINDIGEDMANTAEQLDIYFEMEI